MAPERRDAAASPGLAPLLALYGRGRGAGGRRSRGTGVDGQPVDARPLGARRGTTDGHGARPDLSVPATLRAAAARQAASASSASSPASSRLSAAVSAAAPAVLPQDLHEHVRAGREGNLVVFCVDASGSMGARRRMATVKGAVLTLLLDAYQRRDRVALIAFRGEDAHLALPPTSSVERAAAVLDDLPTGGTTPIAAGLDRATQLLVAERRRAPERRALALLVTDGRASGGRAGRAAAERAATRLAAEADGVVVFDAEEGAVRLGLAGTLARVAGARLLPLSALHSPPPSPAARSAA